MHYDVFNGDADGIIALLQCRWAEPCEGKLITGVKRNIQLLQQVPDSATSVTVLDISLEKNRQALDRLLDTGCKVFYCDHHRAGELPQHQNLEALIDLSAETCTSLLINQRLGGRYVHWAIAAAFGDNLLAVGHQMAKEQGLSEEQTAFLCELGTLINYNGYGAKEADLHFPPAELYQTLMAYPDPFTLQQEPNSPYFILKAGFEADQQQVSAVSAYFETNACRVFCLPEANWARRISGVFGNALANEDSAKAHAVLTLNPDGKSYTVSVRAPLQNRTGADEICSRFPTGGGRQGAAGINNLPLAQLDEFVAQFNQFYA
ncbi:DHH family phosphoesterase [Photobacterium rosenbergii]|uniref:DHH family phosphoesterase n=1 Tax=Photobacterium rosenbergii TaxID=294936 RepID=UPI001C99E5D6|nr:DHH family phosphoesterase [Photobacterium rosenbergii]MBY5947400.1 DHH family phosphoesterase [Photobacterium rosenbergii]